VAYGSTRRRLAAAVALAVALIPIIYSLNRGLWIGLVLAGVYIAVRLALTGRPQVLAVLALGATVVVLVVAISPLGTVIEQRLSAGNSNQVRTSLSRDSFQLALQSPILGYGGTRDKLGSEQSIAIGATVDCPRCGNRTIGSNGHFWNVLFAQGFVGAFLFVGWYVANLWHYRRDVTPVGLAGQAVTLTALLYMFAYVAISSSLSLMMVSIALLWRNQQARGSDPTLSAV
jgi:O-antigen ligase